MKLKIYKDRKEYLEVLEWLDRGFNRRLLFDQPQAELEGLLASENPLLNLSPLASRFRSMSVWWAALFLRDVWEGRGSAPEHGSLMIDYAFESVKLFTLKFDILSRKDKDHEAVIGYLRVYPLFCLLVAFRRIDEALWLGKRIFNSREDKCFRSWEFERPLAGFVLRLYLLMSKNKLTADVVSSLPSCGPYKGLFENWDSDKKLQPSLVDACDEHYLRTQESVERHIGVVEFVSRPYNVIPCEVLAFRVVREMLGKPTSLPSHPLLDSKFVTNLPRELASFQDSNLQRISELAAKIKAL